MYQAIKHDKKRINTFVLLIVFPAILFGLMSCQQNDKDATQKELDQIVINAITKNDPLFEYQWHLINTSQKTFSDFAGTAGEDINLGNSINAYSGSGVIVAVVDSGLEIAHEDLTDNIVKDQSWDFLANDHDPTNIWENTGDHGTSVAGLIAAAGDNGLGGRGVASEASLKGFNFIQNQAAGNQVAALGGSTSDPHASDVHIFNQSYGTTNTYDVPIDPDLEAQLRLGVTSLRSGKGAIYVKSAGNGFNAYGSASCDSANTIGVTCQNANMDSSNAVPWNIVVGALNAEGLKSSYSTAGAALWVSAPGGEYGYAQAKGWSSTNPDWVFKPAMVTTDQSGCDQGYSRADYGSYPAPNFFEDNSNGLNPGCNYTSTFNGTSSAAPVLSGAIALILQANPNLTWRDVRYILANTAEKVDSNHAETVVTLGDGNYTAELAWTTNAAGYPFHNWYGFGRVNVDAAISMATNYSQSLGTFSESAWNDSGTLSLAIPDNSTNGVTNIITTTDNLTLEAVQITLSVTHPYTGDLGIELTSPSGTKSILFNIQNGFGASDNLAGMVLLSNAFYGENSLGNWTIKLVDGSSTSTGTLTDWKIKFYGVTL